MKYSSTVRLINVILFALFAIGFGVLAVYFGFLVAPFVWGGQGPIKLPDSGAFALWAMLGSLGVAGALISLVGLFKSVVSVMKARDDAPVITSFSCYIAIGYVLAMFLLLNAFWLYRLTSANIGYDDVAFVVIVYIIAAILVLIGANVPMMRMFGEGEQLNKVMGILCAALFSVNLGVALVFGVSYFVVNAAEGIAFKSTVTMEMGLAALIPLVAAVLICVAALGYRKADKAGSISKLNGLLFEGALLIDGGAILSGGIIEYVLQSGKNPPLASLVAKKVASTSANYMDFLVMACILGGGLILLSLGLAYSTLKGGKKVVSTL